MKAEVSSSLVKMHQYMEEAFIGLENQDVIKMGQIFTLFYDLLDTNRFWKTRCSEAKDLTTIKNQLRRNCNIKSSLPYLIPSHFKTPENYSLIDFHIQGEELVVLFRDTSCWYRVVYHPLFMETKNEIIWKMVSSVHGQEQVDEKILGKILGYHPRYKRDWYLGMVHYNRCNFERSGDFILEKSPELRVYNWKDGNRIYEMEESISRLLQQVEKTSIDIKYISIQHTIEVIFHNGSNFDMITSWDGTVAKSTILSINFPEYTTEVFYQPRRRTWIFR